MARQLSPAAVAEKTGFMPQTLANWRVQGKGPAHYRIGRLVRYDESVVDAWVEKYQTGAAA